MLYYFRRTFLVILTSVTTRRDKIITLFMMYIGERNSSLERVAVIKIAAIGAKIIDDSVFFMLHLVYWFLQIYFFSIILFLVK